ncbi:MAG TPA: DUF4830 domain-containing protein [Papillibacter sp.]|jgi:hypothetical protein|nr:DUF4830 domain-containing protein [Papillibacter sp.]
MFILTAKFSKRKAVVAVLILAVILIAIILIAGKAGQRSNVSETAALSAVVKNNEQRVKYLNSLGWEVEEEPIEEQKVIIPREFNDIYERYNDLQKMQGFDLSKYGGLEATRYTYKVLNFPDAKGMVVADIIVYRNRVIAGDIQSNALDGFMVGLKYPSGKKLEDNTEETENAEDSSDSESLAPSEPLENRLGENAPDNVENAPDNVENAPDNANMPDNVDNAPNKADNAPNKAENAPD